MTTSANRVDFYVGDKFMKYYNTPHAVKSVRKILNQIEPQIEREFLNSLSGQCAHLIKYRNELEYKLSYYGRYSNYKLMIENELKKIDFSPCERYYKLRDVK